MLAVKGKFKNGVAHPIEPVEAREGQPVIITFLQEDDTGSTAAETDLAWESLQNLVNDCAVETGIPDLAQQHDHYLYGKPKQE